MSSTDDVSSELFKKSYLLPILTIIISLLLGAAEAGGGGSGEETPWPLWELLIVFGIPIITCLIAKARGRGPVRWFFISLLLPVLGLIILLCMSNLKLGRRVMSSPTPLKCDLGKGEPQDDAQAAEWYREAAKDGNAKAQHNLGIMYHEGQGVKRDYAKAVELWTQASGHGLVEAQYNLAHMYANGQGVAQDYAQAAAWFRKAAEQGHAEAQVRLGLMYKCGMGVTRDEAQAAAWTRKAAEQGDAEAQFNLGLMYANGQGVAEDYAQAAAWFRKAAEQGHAEAQVKLDIYADYLKSKEKAENEAKAEAEAEAEARAEASLNKTFIVTYRSTKKGGLIKGHSKMKALFASFDNTEEIEAKTKKEAKEKFKNMNKGILSPQTIVSIEEK